MRTEAVMVPGHPRWDGFVAALSRALICVGTTENARDVLEHTDDVDTEGSLEALRFLGGSCDCEIVFRVAGVAPRNPVDLLKSS